MTILKSFHEMDAGEQREFLAQQLADWIDAGIWSLHRTETFQRRVAMLALSIGIRWDELFDVLRADAVDLGDLRRDETKIEVPR